jgi:hypothetical protein
LLIAHHNSSKGRPSGAAFSFGEIMATASEEILARRAQYDRIEREADALGRIIGVKRLKPSQQIKVEEMAPGLSGTSDFKNEAGEMVAVSRRAPLMLAASVREIDNVPVPFPRDRDALDAILDRLDTEGLEAAGTALSKLVEPGTDGEGTVDAAKN